MEEVLCRFKVRHPAIIALKDPRKARYRHYKYVIKVLGLEASPFHPSVKLVCHFLKLFSQLTITEFDTSLLLKFKNHIKNITSLRILKLETENPTSSRKYKKIFRWCPLIKNLSMRIPYETIPCLRLTRKVKTLDISIPGSPMAKAKTDYLASYFQKLSLLENLVLELPKVVLVDIIGLLNKLPRVRVVGLQGMELELPKKNQNIEVSHLAKIERLKFGAFTMDHIRFLTSNTPLFQNLKSLEASKGNHFVTLVGKKEDISHFEKFKYLESLKVVKLNLRINTLKYEDMLSLINTLIFPIGLEKFHITLALHEIEKEEGLDESIAGMMNQLAKCKDLITMNIQLKVKGSFPSLRDVFTKLTTEFSKLKYFSYAVMGEAPEKIELDKIFRWLATLPELEYIMISIPKRNLTGFKTLKFEEGSFPKLTRFYVMSLYKDILQDFRYFLEYISQIKSMTAMHINSWDEGFTVNDLMDILTYLPKLQNLRELNISINGNKDDLLKYGDLADLMKSIKTLNVLHMFIRVEHLEELPEEELKQKFLPYIQEGKAPKLFVNQFPVVM